MVAAESLPQKFLLNYRHIREMNDARFADSADWPVSGSMSAPAAMMLAINFVFMVSPFMSR